MFSVSHDMMPHCMTQHKSHLLLSQRCDDAQKIQSFCNPKHQKSLYSCLKNECLLEKQLYFMCIYNLKF